MRRGAPPAGYRTDGGLLPDPPGSRGAHPHRGGRGAAQLRRGPAGDAADADHPRVRHPRSRRALEPRVPDRRRFLRLKPRDVLPAGPGRLSHWPALFHLGQHLWGDVRHPVLGVCNGPLLRQDGSAALRRHRGRYLGRCLDRGAPVGRGFRDPGPLWPHAGLGRGPRRDALSRRMGAPRRTRRLTERARE